jgi:NADH pyrophosphatase NudC (nudix superfamily)
MRWREVFEESQIRSKHSLFEVNLAIPQSLMISCAYLKLR